MLNKKEVMPEWKIRDAELTGAPDRSGTHNYMEYLKSIGEAEPATPPQSDSQMYDEILESQKAARRRKK